MADKIVLIAKNVAREGPGLFGQILLERGIGFRIAELASEPFPSPKGYSAAIVLGGPDSANDRTEKMRREIAMAREAVRLGIPYLGVCLGMQVLAKAAGGGVVKHSMNEVGWRGPGGGYFSLELTADGKADPLFAGLPDSFRTFQLHGETIELCDSITLLATGKTCRNQAIRVGKTAYGLQSHFELDGRMLERWLSEDDDLRKLDASSVRMDYESARAEYESAARTIFGNFLRMAGL